jgi:glycosyltransferase involved in cell wall biosynthesis
MDISLIISTRNRCEQLARCLGSLRQITFEHPWELIIVDNGSVDNTAAVAQAFINTASMPTRYVFELKPGKSNALNTALDIAQGQVFAFTDDDCYPAPDFLTQVWSAFEDRRVGYITGRIMLHDPTDYPMTINESVTPVIFPAISLLRSGSVQGANMAFRRGVLRNIGGFDPLMGPGTAFVGEDLDAAGRASAMGWLGRYCPEVVVRHHHGRKASDAPHRMKSYGLGVGAYHAKLLVRGYGFLLFARAIFEIPKRYKQSRRMLFWEPIGAARYTCVYILHAVHSWFATTRVQ